MDPEINIQDSGGTPNPSTKSADAASVLSFVQTLGKPTRLDPEPQSEKPRGLRPSLPPGPTVGSTSQIDEQKQPKLGRTNTSLSSSTSAFAQLSNLQRLSGVAANNAGQSLSKNRILSREFWMKDDNARECYICGSAFSTFRRKHHCRACGQIVDSKCTTYVDGSIFGESAKVKLCTACEGIITSRDDSSDNSDGSTYSRTGSRMRHSYMDEARRSPRRAITPVMETEELENANVGRPTSMSNVPAFAVPLTRKSKDLPYRGSAVLEIDEDPRIPRPQSARSTRSLRGRRSSMIVHRRHHSRTQLLQQSNQNRLKNLASTPIADNYIGSPLGLQQASGNSTKAQAIDPDVAAYMSDDASSGDENAGLSALLLGATNGQQNSDQSMRNRRHSRAYSRHNSVSNQVGPGSPRNGFAGAGQDQSQMLSSASMSRIASDQNLVNQDWQDEDATGIVAGELGKDTLEHASRLMNQLLSDEGLKDTLKWTEVVLPIVLRAVKELKPNLQHGDDIDIRHYVKLKKIVGGTAQDSRYVRGVVFTKNVAHKTMASTIERPRILLLSFPLEYARRSTALMSLEPVMRQEQEYLDNLVHRILALHPQLIFVQRNVSGLALQMLAKAGITVVFNVKQSVLEAISRCTRSRIVSSPDRLLSSHMENSVCGRFSTKSFKYGTKVKTYMYLQDCHKEQGCTITLRGAKAETLSKVKRVAEFMVFVVWHLKLETSLLIDEFAMMPTLQHEGTITNGDRTESSVEVSDKQIISQAESKPKADSAGSTETTDSAFALDQEQIYKTPAYNNLQFISHNVLLDKHKTKILSISPIVRFMQPLVLTRAQEQERRLMYLEQVLKQDSQESENPKTSDKFTLVTPEMVRQASKNSSKVMQEVVRAIHEAEYEKTLYIYRMQSRHWSTFISENPRLFSPYAHQRITVLFSMHCFSTGIPCTAAELLTFNYYNQHDFSNGVEPDFTLGQFIEDLCLNASELCDNNGCGRPMVDHYRIYVHGAAQLTIKLSHQSTRMQGLDNAILMWNTCRICQAETPTVLMSQNTWAFSFAKYLELSFWGEKIVPRAGVCSHDLHRDYIRCFGLKNVVVKFENEAIRLFDIVVPRLRITWKVLSDVKYKNEAFQRIEGRLNAFTKSVQGRIANVKWQSIPAEKHQACHEVLGKMTIRITEEHARLLEQLRTTYTDSKYYEIIPLNKIVRELASNLVTWTNSFDDFDQEFLLSEKDIRKLASQELKNYFLEKEKDSLELATVTAEDTTNTEKPPIDSSGDTSPADPSEQEVVELPKTEVLPEIEEAKSEETSRPATEDRDQIQLSNGTDETATKAPAEETLDVKTQHHDEEKPRPSRSAAGEGHDSEPAKEQGLAPLKQLPGHARVKSLEPPGPGIEHARSVSPKATRKPDAKLAARFGMRNMPKLTGRAPSLIPRSIQSSKLNSRVTTLAQHFDQLSREFARERIRDREQLAAKFRNQRMYPSTISKPRVEVLKNTKEVFSDKDGNADVSQTAPEAKSQEAPVTSPPESDRKPEKLEDSEHTEAPKTDEPMKGQDEDAAESARSSEEDQNTIVASAPETGNNSDEEEEQDASTEPSAAPSQGTEAPPDFGKHERSSIMKMLSNFWADRTSNNWQPLEQPLSFFDHFVADSEVIIREDEPSSLVSYVLDNGDYKNQLSAMRNKSSTVEIAHDRVYVDQIVQDREEQFGIEKSLSQPSATHLQYSFSEGTAKFACKVFYVEQFDAVRRKCGVAERFVETLSRCVKWDSKGGKTKSVFLKTLDDRLVLKSLSPVESQSFMQFAPAYFELIGEALFHELPSCIAKMLGFFQIVIKNPVTGIDFSNYVLVMENLFYDRQGGRTFDLKGSMRNRRIQPTGQDNEVLLDENMVDMLFEKPLFARDFAKKLLRSSIFNDTLFLQRMNVMDYSLMVLIDEDRSELVVGIIDCIRTYTWDKKLESWIKDRGKNRPTVTSPKEYKARFREAMNRYFLEAPNCWHHFKSALPELGTGRQAIQYLGDDDEVRPDETKM